MYRLLRLMFCLAATIVFFSNDCFSQKWDTVYLADKLPEKSGWKIDDGLGAGNNKWWTSIPDPDNYLTNELLHVEDHAGRKVTWYKAFEGEENPPGITVCCQG